MSPRLQSLKDVMFGQGKEATSTETSEDSMTTSGTKEDTKVDTPPHMAPFFNQEKDTPSPPKEDDVNSSPSGSDSIGTNATEELTKWVD